MCGRFTLAAAPALLAEAFGLEGSPDLAPRYNIAPTQRAAVLRQSADGSTHLELLRWGLIPGWAKDASIASRLINARSETVAEKPAFRSAFRQRRCLVPADGFYEWRREGRARQPWYFHRPDGAPFAFAGLWERWRAPDGEAVETFTLLTTEANATVRPVHPRMPVILPFEAQGAWLDPALTEPRQLEPWLAPAADSLLIGHPVSPRVNGPGEDDPGLVLPLPG